MSDVSAALVQRFLQTVGSNRAVQPTDFTRLPAPVAQLLHARLATRVDREAAPPETPWVDRNTPALAIARDAWRDAARDAAHVPADAWPAFLAETTALVVRHLVDPAATLAAHAFADTSDPLPTPLVLSRLGAFAPYAYLPEVVERYIEKKGLAHIDRDGLETLLRRIESRMVAPFAPDDWLVLLDPVFELLGSVGDPEGTVAASLVREAFAARGAAPLAADLPDRPVSRDGLREHLSAPRHAPERAEPAPLETEPTASAHPAAPIIGSRYNTPEETAPDDSDVIGTARPVEVVAPMGPMESLTMPVTPSSGDGVRDAVVTEIHADDAPLWKRHARQDAPTLHEVSQDDAPLWTQFADATPTTHSLPSGGAPVVHPTRTASLDDLEAAVLGSADSERRAWFTDELFAGDASDYRETLACLDAARTWTEATDIIARDVFRKHRVNIYSEAAIAFTDAVEIQMERA